MTERTALYRHFDSNGRLLYVGISLNAVYRLAQHRRGAEWYCDICRVDIEHFDTREEALEAELKAIRNERPQHNKAGVDKSGESPKERWHRQRDEFEPMAYGPRPAAETLIAWNRPGEKGWKGGPVAGVAVGSLLKTEITGDWSRPYDFTGGAAYTARRKLPPAEQKFQVMCDYYELVKGYGLDPYIVHRAFLEIIEYREIIKEMGHGPDQDEPGHDPEVPWGERCAKDRPKFNEQRVPYAYHIWPRQTLDGRLA